MPKFFVAPEDIRENTAFLTGDDAAHAAKTLRMRPGETLTICDGNGMDYACRVVTVSPQEVELTVLEALPCPAEPETDFTLWMALPKGDKLELVVQKAVELGAARICVYRSAFCVPDPDPRAFAKRLTRLQRIAREAAGQSGRGRIPEVAGLYTYDEMLAQAAQDDLPLFFYERGGVDLRTALDSKPYRKISAVIGPEGGFSEEEARRAHDAGLVTAYLGARILRCETAALCAAATVMFHAGEMA